MTPNDYIDATKNAIGITSDYELAKRLEVSRGNITTFRTGERNIPLATAFKIAIALNLDPALVVADLEAQREKNEKRAEFWRSFLSRAVIVGAMVCTLASAFIGDYAREAAATGGAAAAKVRDFLRRLGSHNLGFCHLVNTGL